MTRKVSDDERRARLAVRHLLSPASRREPVQVVQALVAMHSTDPATVYLSAAARGVAEPAMVEKALYDDAGLTRMLAMRRTLFVVPRADVGMVQAAASAKVAATERKKLLGFLAENGGWDARWLAEVEEVSLAALRERGELFAAELSAVDPRLAERITMARGKRYEASQSVASRVLLLLAAEGRIVRGRPRGSWLSSQYRWAIAPPHPELNTADAQRELATRWLAAYGPATVDDLKWWTGWTLTETRAALAGIDAVEVQLEAGTGVILRDDMKPAAAPEPWAALLPGLDSTPMGWKNRDFYLAPGHREELFDRSGNIGPTVWWNGVIVGGWSQRPDGEVVWELLTSVDAAAARAIQIQADQLQDWLAGVRITPRFQTPLYQRLAS